MIRYLSIIKSLVKNNNHQPDLPRFLTYITTFRCNARCVMCDSWKKPSGYELTLGEIQKIFSQLPRMDVVRLTGGEPFLRKDLNEIVDLVETYLKPIVLHITTNGLLSDRIIRFCENRSKKKILQLLISIDGMPEKQNYNRGLASAWTKVTNTLHELKSRELEFNCKLSVNQTLTDNNSIDHYYCLNDYLKSYEIPLNVVFAYVTSATYNTSPEILISPQGGATFSPFSKLSPQKISAFACDYEKNLNSSPFYYRLMKKYYMKGVTNRLIGRTDWPNPNCVELSSHIRLMPDGSIPTCQFNTTTVGNLRKQLFSEIWSSKRIHRQRNWVNCCSGCWAECEVVPNAIYSGDILKFLMKTWQIKDLQTTSPGIKTFRRNNSLKTYVNHKKQVS